MLLLDESMYQKVILKEFQYPSNSGNFMAIELQVLSDDGNIDKLLVRMNLTCLYLEIIL